MTPERALTLLADFNTARRLHPMLATEEEQRVIRERLAQLPAHGCWYDALASLAYPEAWPMLRQSCPVADKSAA